MKVKSIKTLVASLTAIAISFAMLLGTTFAWFTDSVNNTNTIIKSGNVDVELWHTNLCDTVPDGIGYNEEKGTQVDGKTKLFLNKNGENILWEPEASVGEIFRIKNVGSLALKYQFTIKPVSKTVNANGESLTDVLTLQVINIAYNGIYYVDTFGDGYTVSGELYAGEETDYWVNIYWLQSIKDNDFTDLKLNVGIELVATQLSYEYDGEGNGFDSEAEFPNVSTSVVIENMEEGESALLKTKSENAVSASVPAEVIKTLPEDVKELSLVHTEPIEENGALYFESIEIVDQDGKVVDLEKYNTSGAKIVVNLPKQSTFAEGEEVAIYHNGKFAFYTTVGADGIISYEVAHFCQVDVKSAKDFVEDMVEENGIYKIDNLAQLIDFQKKVNAGNNFSGKTVVLTNDIDLSSIENWTPISSFNGIFDGGNHTIKNLTCIQEGKSGVGLFGNTYNGEIKNLVVENAIVKGRLNVGVVAGQPYTSKYTNIIVKGHVEVNGLSYVGGVGGKNVYADWTDIKVNVDETSYVNAYSIENEKAYRSYVGGVIGFMGEGSHVVSNVYSNIDVKGSTIDVGGITGIIHYGNTFRNCVSAGNVEIYACEDSEDVEEIGGIAGVWHNGGQNVTIENCQFTGTLKTNVEADLTDNVFTGKAYNETGKGNLIIDTIIVYDIEDLQAALENGKNVYLANDITVSKEYLGSNGYGATAINVLNNQTIFGNGHSLIIEKGLLTATWDSAINITSGKIKDLKIVGGFRGVFVNHNGKGGEVILDNVNISNSTYTISCDQGTNNGLTVINSEINGWTSYAGTIGEVEFIKCSFGEGSGYAFCRPYAKTTFKGCTFAENYTMDPCSNVSFENCKLGEVALTKENLSILVTSIENATIIG